MRDYVVVRRHPLLPAVFDTGDLDGKWFDRASIPPSTLHVPVRIDGVTAAVTIAVPTGRFEVREDGAVAEVWEIAP